jgi:hypothetical protein
MRLLHLTAAHPSFGRRYRPATPIVVNRLGAVSQVSAETSLGGGQIHWYRDGQYVAPGDVLSVQLDALSRVEHVASNDPLFDPLTVPQAAGALGTRTLFWVRSLDVEIDKYRIEQAQKAPAAGSWGAWTPLAIFPDDPSKWSYQFTTAVLADLTDYRWQIVPIRKGSIDGDPLPLGPEFVLRTPDAPAYTISFNPVTGRITITAA